MTAPAGRRARKKAATRSAIQHAALRLAVELGPERLTVQSISEAADVSRSTFFNYFAGKEDALTPDPPWTAAELLAAVAARPAGEPPLDSLRAVLLEAAVRLDGEPEHAALWPVLFRRHPELAPRHNVELTRVMIEAVGARTGLDPDSDPYPELLTRVALAAFWTARRCWTGDPPLADRLATAFDQVAAGLPEPGAGRR